MDNLWIAYMPRKYVWGFNNIEIGKEIIIPWPTQKAHRILNSVRSEARRKGKKFYTEGRPSGLYIRRLK